MHYDLHFSLLLFLEMKVDILAWQIFNQKIHGSELIFVSALGNCQLHSSSPKSKQS